MTKVSRDVLIVSRLSNLSEKALEQEFNRVIPLLHSVESVQHFCASIEIIDTARYKIIRKPHKIAAALQGHTSKPFVFVFNKN